MNRNLIWAVAALGLLVGIVFFVRHQKPAPAPTLTGEREFDTNKPPKTYKDALETQKVTKQKILVVFGAEWCGPCKKLHNETLADPEIKELLVSYIFIYIDSDANKELAHSFNVEALPSYYVIDNGKISKEGSGYKSTPEFKKWLH